MTFRRDDHVRRGWPAAVICEWCGHNVFLKRGQSILPLVTYNALYARVTDKEFQFQHHCLAKAQALYEEAYEVLYARL